MLWSLHIYYLFLYDINIILSHIFQMATYQGNSRSTLSLAFINIYLGKKINDAIVDIIVNKELELWLIKSIKITGTQSFLISYVIIVVMLRF